MSRLQRQRGAAIIVAMLIMALACGRHLRAAAAGPCPAPAHNRARLRAGDLGAQGGGGIGRARFSIRMGASPRSITAASCGRAACPAPTSSRGRCPARSAISRACSTSTTSPSRKGERPRHRPGACWMDRAERRSRRRSPTGSTPTTKRCPAGAEDDYYLRLLGRIARRTSPWWSSGRAAARARHGRSVLARWWAFCSRRALRRTPVNVNLAPGAALRHGSRADARGSPRAGEHPRPVAIPQPGRALLPPASAA